MIVHVEPMGTVRMTRGMLNYIKSGNYDPNDSKIKSILKYLHYKELLSWEARTQIGQEMITGPIRINSLNFYLPIPQGWAIKKKIMAREGILPHVSKPDIDNLEKGVFDSLNKIAWKDDSQIIKVKDKGKQYGEAPRIELEFEVIA